MESAAPALRGRSGESSLLHITLAHPVKLASGQTLTKLTVRGAAGALVSLPALGD